MLHWPACYARHPHPPCVSQYRQQGPCALITPANGTVRVFAHNFHVIETPPHLANLSDAILLVDDASALIRFHRDHARSKEIFADPEACKPYHRRFEDIWNEGGNAVSATTAGL
ncbi:MAG: hypothetical protein IPL58_05555 [Betaproteobacteria bacterium]|uniref:Uncharacterized protein n=1 Tax=Candidatus Proximibacter danicus TaxID=2954365 RepID=A0A9D7K2U0_9PROT|nr:hypothetical protein [Candidatus Proximibacter danicus]